MRLNVLKARLKTRICCYEARVKASPKAFENRFFSV